MPSKVIILLIIVYCLFSNAFVLNKEESGNHFEGDMILSVAQINLINQNSQHRNGLLEIFHQWKNNTVPYLIDSTKFEKQHVEQIHLAMNKFHEISCVQFRPKVLTDLDYIFITDNNTGCSSDVGRRGGIQLVYLAKDIIGHGCFRIGTILHELLHTLGFIHMHSSSLRDKYINIIWSEIRRDSLHNFQIYKTSTSFGEEYDLDSVMHYGRKSFSKSGSDTIIPKDPSREIGQRVHMSELDIIKLNLMYKCSNNKN